MPRDRFFRTKNANITDRNSVRLADLVCEEAKRLSNLHRPEFVIRFVEDSYAGQGADWDNYFSELATHSVAEQLADGKLKAYAVSEDGSDVRIVSKRYWRTKDDALNFAAIGNRLFAASFGKELDPRTPDTLRNSVTPIIIDGKAASEASLGYNLFITKTNLDDWKRRMTLTIDGLMWDQPTLQYEYEKLPPSLQAAMSNDNLAKAAKGSGVTVRQVRALQRAVRPPLGRKPGGKNSDLGG